jgi:hypothetical protein
MKDLGLFSLGLLPLLKAGNLLSSEGQIKESKMETGISTQKEKGDRVQIPPIDAMVPDRIETATFALG